jgi:hypothetical protein
LLTRNIPISIIYSFVQFKYEGHTDTIFKTKEATIVEYLSPMDPIRISPHQPFSTTKTKSVSFMGGGEPVEIKVALPKTCFQTGSEVPVKVSIRNNSKTRLSGLRLAIVRKLHLFKPGTTTIKTSAAAKVIPSIETELHFREKDQTYEPGEHRTTLLHIHVPNQVINVTNNTALAMVTCTLQVGLNMGAGVGGLGLFNRNDLLVEVPIDVYHANSLAPPEMKPLPACESRGVEGMEKPNMAPLLDGMMSPKQNNVHMDRQFVRKGSKIQLPWVENDRRRRPLPPTEQEKQPQPQLQPTNKQEAGNAVVNADIGLPTPVDSPPSASPTLEEKSSVTSDSNIGYHQQYPHQINHGGQYMKLSETKNSSNLAMHEVEAMYRNLSLKPSSKPRHANQYTSAEPPTQPTQVEQQERRDHPTQFYGSWVCESGNPGVSPPLNQQPVEALHHVHAIPPDDFYRWQYAYYQQHHQYYPYYYNAQQLNEQPPSHQNLPPSNNHFFDHTMRAPGVTNANEIPYSMSQPVQYSNMPKTYQETPPIAVSHSAPSHPSGPTGWHRPDPTNQSIPSQKPNPDYPPPFISRLSSENIQARSARPYGATTRPSDQHQQRQQSVTSRPPLVPRSSAVNIKPTKNHAETDMNTYKRLEGNEEFIKPLSPIISATLSKCMYTDFTHT